MIIASCLAGAAYYAGWVGPSTRLDRVRADLSAAEGQLGDAGRRLVIASEEAERLKREAEKQNDELTRIEKELAQEQKRVASLEEELAGLTWAESTVDTDLPIEATQIDGAACSAVDEPAIRATLHDLFQTKLDRTPRSEEIDDLTVSVSMGLTVDCELLDFMSDPAAAAEVAFYDSYGAELDFRRRQADSARTRQLVQQSFEKARDMIMGN